MKVLINIALIYVCLTFIIYLLSDSMIYAPPKSSYTDDTNIIKITTSSGEKLSAVYLKQKTDTFTILYSHGNAEDLHTITPILQALYAMGYSVISYDYAGYGTSTGHPSEKEIYKDIDSIYEYLLMQGVKPAQIIVFGRSLGSGPSIELAKNKPVAGLILEGAFVSIYRVVSHYPIFLFDKYNNLSKLNSINVPILFIHGQKDIVVPFWHGQMLYDNYKGTKEYLWLHDKGHNDINPSSYQNAIMSFTKTLK